MRALDQRRVKRDDIHQRAGAKRALGEAPADAEPGEADRGIEKEFHRVIARLAVNIDGPRVVRRLGAVVPVVISEPAIRARERNKFSRARVIQAKFRLGRVVEHAFELPARLRPTP